MGIEIPLLLRFEPVLQQFQTGALIGAGVAGARAIAVVQPQFVMLGMFRCVQARIQAAIQPFVTASEQYIARLAQIHTTKITSVRQSPPATPALSIVMMMLMLGMILGSPWLSPWLSRVLPVPLLLWLLVAVMLLFFCFLLYPYFAHRRSDHRYGYH